MESSLKVKIGTLVATGALAFSLMPAATAFAANNVEGGWSEDTGYFATEDANANGGISLYSNPNHRGKAETTVINGTSNKRAHGWTTWTGVYHYTTAQIEHTWPESGVIKTSGRIYGTSNTEAISPWNPFRPNIDWGTAKTYYGRG